MNESSGDTQTIPIPTKEKSDKLTTNHLLKIDVPLVTQEYHESRKHYIAAISEKVLDPNGYMTIKTKIEHYLYTLNTSNEIGKPLLSDIVRFPQDVLTTCNDNSNGSKEEDNSQESVLELNCFKNLQIKSNFKLMNDKKKKKSKRYRNTERIEYEDSSEYSDGEYSGDDVGSICNCICNDVQDEDSECNCSTDSY